MSNENEREKERVQEVMRKRKQDMVTLISQEENEMRQYLVC